MEQIPPQLPWHSPAVPVAPTVIPRLPTRVQQPGRQAPLPDAVAVRPCAVPATAPPFDDERREAVTSAAERPPDRGKIPPGEAVGGSADLDPVGTDRGAPNPVGTDRGAPNPGVPDPGVPAPGGPAPGGPAPGGPAPGGPAPGESDSTRPGTAGGWPSQFAQVLAETLAGARPAQQLIPWTTEQARQRIRQLGPMLATDQRPKVRRIMTSAPTANVLELTAVVGFGPRVRVLALRLEREQGRAYRQGGSRWRCTAIESA
jgi:hypothetical protein